MHPIQEIIKRNRAKEHVGIYSCCSANEYVLRAAMQRAKKHNIPVLIEATANQVNQDGGYTGMKPLDFYNWVNELAQKYDFPKDQLILGGDHLGPLTWQDLPEKEAMEKSEELVRQYVAAGFTKIHLDTSMRVADDDPNARLLDETIARRGAQLCTVAEQAYQKRKEEFPTALAPVYIIGSEVPIPGGAQEKEDSVEVTDPKDCLSTLACFEKAFHDKGLQEAWERVCGLVVQPGVEFGDTEVFYYDPKSAKNLISALDQMKGIAFEGHSTDYQTPACLRNMVSDGIAILKVGPALTFGLREGFFALEMLERELCKEKNLSNFRQVLDNVMVNDPKYWAKYYPGTEEEKAFARAFSYSDRARYYLPNSNVQKAVDRLIGNIDALDKLPESILSQYMPLQYKHVCSGEIKADAVSLVMDRVGDYIDDYLFAILP